jgi:phage-related protein
MAAVGFFEVSTLTHHAISETENALRNFIHGGVKSFFYNFPRVCQKIVDHGYSIKMLWGDGFG